MQKINPQGILQLASAFEILNRSDTMMLASEKELAMNAMLQRIQEELKNGKDSADAQ